MERRHIVGAADALDDAIFHLDSFTAARGAHKDITASRRNYMNFIVAAARPFAIFQRSARRGPAKMWIENVQAERDQDELLAWFAEARRQREHEVFEGLEEHEGIEPVSVSVGGISLVVAAARHGLRPRDLVKTQRDSAVRIFPIPRNHLGQPIRPRTGFYLTDIGSLLVAYTERTIASAGYYAVKPGR